MREIVVLSGGVGGARFVDGVVQALGERDRLTVIVNTGDDFWHWGLRICPDLDTVMYTLSGLADEKRGWGLSRETFQALEMVQGLGGDSWFMLGDRDLGTHLTRTEALRSGMRLTEVTGALYGRLSVSTRVLPMSDHETPTMVETEDEGLLDFQTWLVRRRAEPVVSKVYYDGPSEATPEVLSALDAADVILVAPSNPYVSIDPILRLDGVGERLASTPSLGVSPIVHGAAVKGPLAAMIPALERCGASASAVLAHYRGQCEDALNGWVVAPGDAVDAGAIQVLETDIVMHDRSDRGRLAREVLAFASELR